MTDQEKIDALSAFKQIDKFSTEAWNERGLNKPAGDLCMHLNNFFNSCADRLIESINEQTSVRELKSILKSALTNINKLSYDTEEKEFICDLFYRLASIVGVDFMDALNKWQYGSLLSRLMKIRNLLRPERITDTLRQPCTQCKTELETFILRREDGIPETSWLICRCKNCGELNLLSHGPNVKKSKFGNYEWVDTLSMNEYSYEQALTRLEQVKFFRG